MPILLAELKSNLHHGPPTVTRAMYVNVHKRRRLRSMTFEWTAQAVVNYMQWALSCYGLCLSSQSKKDGERQEPNKYVDYYGCRNVAKFDRTYIRSIYHTYWK